MKEKKTQAGELKFKISGLSNDNTEKVDILIKLAKTYAGKSPSKVLESGKQAFALAKKLNYPEGEAKALNIIGISYWSLGEYDTAIEYYHRSLQISEEHNFNHLMAATMNNIGVIYHESENGQKAIEYYHKAMKIFKENNDTKNVANATNNIGVIYSSLKEYGKSLQYGLQTLEYYKKIGDKKDMIHAYNNIGNLYFAISDNKKALDYYQHALEISKEIKEYYVTAKALNNIGKVYLNSEKLDKAKQYVEEALKYARKIESKMIMMESYELFSDLYFARKDYKQSLKYHKNYIKIKNEIFNKTSSDKIAELQAKYEIEKKDKEIELLQKENEIIKIQLESKQKLEKVQVEIVRKNEKINLISRELESLIEKDFIGISENIKSVLELAFTSANNKDTHVLITGENGTGKEIIARIIHHASERKKEAFIPVNCTAIPETLLESEFFGHRKGAFTGAIENKKGLFELADNGTLFLDEIADMPPSLQAKLLRVIEEKKFKRIGENTEIHVNVRIISATNRNIKQLIDKKEFRIDLYYRINTLEINIPPLRERPEDIEPLIRHFAEFFAKKMKKPIPKISKELIHNLRKYNFPGNVRELKNLIERVMILSKNNFLDVSDFPITSEEITEQSTIESAEADNEKIAIKKALRTTDFNQIKAAELLGISRLVLIRRMKKYNIVIKKTV